LPSVRELLEHNKTALLVEPNNPEALAQALRTVLTDYTLARRLSGEALTKVAGFSWPNRAKHLLDFLPSL
jgi:L-malate glycosyltransferase